MENKYCRVGTITPNVNGRQAVSLLEYQYQNLMDKANQLKELNDQLGDFFEAKAMQIKKILETLVP
ncbi:hypothetical protein [Zeaxanthinibacter enoshimensis]|uniref:Uncharacterized protein n=1 Tax=Zeaxanthinibacter enoshimensis TaxID=392009 RepID=A0A4R6TFQ6_9FLAO|nr:hypothetical protein [Zeaxanthinibacter enoshimensis]TDQ29165.1 hypothetical protein CLV82_2619 [Zeaxanthinibacter enoshimensis]